MIRRLVIPLLLALSDQPSFGDLPVIHDSGQTQSLAPLLRPLLPDSVAVEKAQPEYSSAVQPAGLADLSILLPIRSPGLSPGKLDTAPVGQRIRRYLAQVNPRPFFLIGADALSLLWLSRHRDGLIEIGAIGLLVQAENAEEVRRVAEAARGLPVGLGSGTDLGTALGIDRYPVLITREGFLQ